MPILPVYISGYTRQNGKGIYLYSFDTDTGLLTNPQLAAECESPSYITIHRPSEQLFAVNETNEYNGQQDTGYVSSFRRTDTGALTLLNTQSSQGSDPCYLTVRGQHCLVSNYMGGSILSLPLTPDGFGTATTHLDLGSDLGIQASRATSRQEAPHAHAIDVDPLTHRLAIVMDLGSDAAILVPYDPTTGRLDKATTTTFEFPPGTGPRHVAFAPNMRSFAYVLGELSNEIFMLELNMGTFNQVQQISALPADVPATHAMLGAEIDITPNGRFLYATVRGHDSISVFYIDDRTGKLKFVENQSTLGQHPRYFVIDPHGNYLIVANQMSDNIVTFKIDQESGRLTHVQTIEQPEATCIKFWF